MAEKNLHAFEELFRALFKPLCAFAVKYVGDLDEAKSLVHEVFISLWDKFDTLPPGTNHKSYLYTAVRNRSLNYLRDKKKHVILDYAADQPVPEDYHSVESTELEENIRRALESLPEKCREVFEMNRVEGLKYAQIAEKMQISIKTVEAQMSKALSILRERLTEFLSLLFFLNEL